MFIALVDQFVNRCGSEVKPRRKYVWPCPTVMLDAINPGPASSSSPIAGAADREVARRRPPRWRHRPGDERLAAREHDDFLEHTSGQPGRGAGDNAALPSTKRDAISRPSPSQSNREGLYLAP